jgi:hypothetical protein
MLKGLGNQRLSRSTVVKAQLAAIKKRMNQLQENTIHQDPPLDQEDLTQGDRVRTSSKGKGWK